MCPNDRYMCSGCLAGGFVVLLLQKPDGDFGLLCYTRGSESHGCHPSAWDWDPHPNLSTQALHKSTPAADFLV